MRSVPWSAGLLAALLFAGCTSPPEDTARGDPVPDGPAPFHVLEGVLEPAELAAPTFLDLGTVAQNGPIQGTAGEPSIWAHLDGTLYLAFPGCDQGAFPPTTTVTPRAPCNNGPVYRSDDTGITWSRLNRAEDGRLAEPGEGPNANGDNEVTVDAAGTVYASNLGARGIQVWSSADRGATWAYLGNTTPQDHWADRQWLAAGGPGHVIVTWMGGTNSPFQRAVAVNTTFDGGGNWTGVEYLGEGIGWLGPVVMEPDGHHAYIPFTEPVDSGLGQPGTFTMKVGRTQDGGRSWDVLETGVEIRTTAYGDHWSGVHMAPAADVTGDGRVVVAWSEDVLDATGFSSVGAVVKLIASEDHGATWSQPVQVTVRTTAIMPWVTGGGGDRVMINYYASDVGLDSDYAGQWDVAVTVVDGVGSPSPRLAHATVATDVHYGGLCSRGSGCSVPSDRRLLDFFESDVLPDGRFIVSYGADPPQEGRYAQIRVAVQDGGSPLFVRPAS
jgi:hypothetical protein